MNTTRQENFNHRNFVYLVERKINNKWGLEWDFGSFLSYDVAEMSMKEFEKYNKLYKEYNEVISDKMIITMEDFFNKPYPLGIESISLLPNLTQGLFDRGYNNEQVTGIIGGNWFRKFKEVAG